MKNLTLKEIERLKKALQEEGWIVCGKTHADEIYYIDIYNPTTHNGGVYNVNNIDDRIVLSFLLGGPICELSR